MTSIVDQDGGHDLANGDSQGIAHTRNRRGHIAFANGKPISREFGRRIGEKGLTERAQELANHQPVEATRRGLPVTEIEEDKNTGFDKDRIREGF